MDNRLDEKEFARMLRAGLKKVRGVARRAGKAISNAADKSFEKGQARRAQMPPEEQEAEAKRKDQSRWADFRGQGQFK